MQLDDTHHVKHNMDIWMWTHGWDEYMDMDIWMKTLMKHMDVMRHMDEHMDETHGYVHMDGMNTWMKTWIWTHG